MLARPPTSDHRASRWRGGAWPLVLVLGVACRNEATDPERTSGPSIDETTGGEPEGTSTGEPEPLDNDASDLCDRAPKVGAGVHQGTLRGRSSQLDGACGQGGPDAFFRLEVPRRSDIQLRGLGAGFVPRVGVLPNTCSPGWTSRTMLCDEGVGTWLLDVAEGSSLVVSVGIDPDHPALGQPPPSVGADPLSFELEVTLRNVLGPGDPCLPIERGRCGSGTACLPTPADADDPEAEPGPSVCTPLAADTCDSAEPLPLALGLTAVEIDPAAVHTDAHAHGCGGARRRERVLRLELPPTGLHRLEVRGDRPELGFAVRSPGCLPEEERACAAPQPDAPAVLVAELGETQALLFIELPPDDDDGAGETEGSSTGTEGSDTGGDTGEEAPIVVELELAEVAP